MGDGSRLESGGGASPSSSATTVDRKVRWQAPGLAAQTGVAQIEEHRTAMPEVVSSTLVACTKNGAKARSFTRV